MTVTEIIVTNFVEELAPVFVAATTKVKDGKPVVRRHVPPSFLRQSGELSSQLVGRCVIS